MHSVSKELKSKEVKSEARVSEPDRDDDVGSHQKVVIMPLPLQRTCSSLGMSQALILCDESNKW